MSNNIKELKDEELRKLSLDEIKMIVNKLKIENKKLELTNLKKQIMIAEIQN